MSGRLGEAGGNGVGFLPIGHRFQRKPRLRKRRDLHVAVIAREPRIPSAQIRALNSDAVGESSLYWLESDHGPRFGSGCSAENLKTPLAGWHLSECRWQYALT